MVLNFCGLFKILIDRLFPKCVAELSVMFDGRASCPCLTRSMEVFGRVEGLLSPALFAMYMNVLIALLRYLCYADDIVLISDSICAMQCMLNTYICKVFAGMVDVKFNSSKSVAIRVECKYADLGLSLCQTARCFLKLVNYVV